MGIITLQDARAEAKRRLAQYTLGREQPESHRVGGALSKSISAEVAKRCKPRTHADYDYFLNRYVRYGDTRLFELSAARHP